MVLSGAIAGEAPDQGATANAAAAEIHTATCGERYRGETAATCREKGRPPSRAKANSMREFEVTEESPQNHIATMATQTSAPPARVPRAARSTWMNGVSAAAAAGRC